MAASTAGLIRYHIRGRKAPPRGSGSDFAMAHSRALRRSSTARALDKILLQIAAELKVRPAQVNAAVTLLDGGATVPFIARYRKEATDGLDDIQLRDLESAAGLPARAGRAPRRGAQEHRGAGQADARAGRRHRRRADQAGAGRPLPAVQAEAPHQGHDRPRGRPRAAGRPAVRRSRRSIRTREAAAFVNAETRGFADAFAGARRRARPAVRALGRGRRARGGAARVAVGRGPAAVEEDATARTSTTPTSPSSATTSTTPSRSAPCPRTARWPCSAAARRRSSTPS